MVFTQREIFIQAMTTMITSETAKALPREVRGELLRHIRNNICPQVSNDDWHIMAQDINDNSKSILNMMRQNLDKSEDPNNVAENEAMLKLDRAILDSVKEIDFDKLDLSDAPKQVREWIESKRDD